MTRPLVVVLDYGSGNVHSAVKALELAGAQVELTADRQRAEGADGLVVPGVGAFSAVMGALRDVAGDRIVERRLADDRPVLGICVGMQVMFERGIERGIDTPGLGHWPGTVEQLPSAILPHIGWNTLDASEDSVLFDGIGDERFYFVHSNAAQYWSPDAAAGLGEARVTWARHEVPFLAALESGPLTATQFHPEKSGSAGIRLLANWLGTLG